MFNMMLGAEQYLGEKRWVEEGGEEDEESRRTRRVGGGQAGNAFFFTFFFIKLAMLEAPIHLIIYYPKQFATLKKFK